MSIWDVSFWTIILIFIVSKKMSKKKRPKLSQIHYCVFKLIKVTLTKPSVTEDKIFISFPVSFRNWKS